MKKVDIISNIVARKGEALATPSKDISKVNLSGYLLKSIWDKVFEIRTDSQGTEYIFGKIPVVTQYGITMYSGDGVDIPSLASGLPFDGRTIWYNPDTQQIEVIGGTGGGSGEGVSNFWDLSGIPSWITNSKPKYTYSEIEGTPDLTKYALASQIPSLSGYATESWVAKQNYATKATTLSGYGITDAYTKTNVDDLLKAYVTLSGSQTITGEKNFTGGLKVNGSPIYYDTEKKYWKLEGDLLVTGGVTMYGSDSSFTPSTIMDAILYDSATLGINSNGQLYVKGGTSGGGLDITALQNYLTQNSYLNVTSGDNRYLQLKGGTLKDTLKINTSYSNYVQHRINDVIKAEVGYHPLYGVFIKNETSNKFLNVTDKGDALFDGKTIYHSGNFTPSDYLPLSGGTINSTFGGLEIKRNNAYASAAKYSNTSGVLGYIGFNDNLNPMLWNKSRGELGVILHSGNYSQYALPLSGGTINGNIQLGDDSNTSYYALLAKQNGNVVSLGLDYGYGTLGYRQSGTTNWDLLSVANKNVLCSFDGGNNWNTIWHSGNDGSGSGLDADLLDGKQPSELNVGSATKLQTARTIWGQSFDGTGDVGVWTTLYSNPDSYNLTILSNGNPWYGVKTYMQWDEGYTMGVCRIGTSYIHNGLSIGFSTGNPYNFINSDSFTYQDVIVVKSAGNVGIGTTSPSCKLDVNGSLKINEYIDVREPNTKNRVTAYVYSGVGRIYSYNDDNGYNDLYLGQNSTNAIVVKANSNVGIGTANPAQRLHVNGDVCAISYRTNGDYGVYVGSNFTGGLTDNDIAYYANIHSFYGNILTTGGITMYSMRKLKNIVDERGLSLTELSSIKPTRYTWKDGRDNRLHFGGIADDIQQVLPEVVYSTSDGILTMDYGNAAFAVASSLIKPVIDHEKRIELLEEENKQLRLEVERLKSA